MSGMYFEELEPGLMIRHQLSRTVAEADNVLMCSLTMNPQPLHLDHELAAASPHGRPIVNGIYTLGLMMGMTVYETTLGTTVGNLGFDKVRYHAPVFVGDTLRAETEVLSRRRSNSRPDSGIVEFEHRCRNQDDVAVLTCRRAGLMLCRPEKEPHE